MNSELPIDIEAVVLAKGPRAYGRLWAKSGGASRMAELSGASRVTFSRWRYAVPCGTGAQSRYDAMWWGYPAPLPALDRAMSSLVEDEPCFLTMAVRSRGAETIRDLDNGELLSLRDVYGGDLDIAMISERSGMPRTTIRRLVGGVRYPRQCQIMDRVCLSVVGMGWLDWVIGVDESILINPIPARALREIARRAVSRAGLGVDSLDFL